MNNQDKDKGDVLRELLERKKGLGPNGMVYGPNPFKKGTACVSIKTKFKSRKAKK